MIWYKSKNINGVLILIVVEERIGSVSLFFELLQGARLNPYCSGRKNRITNIPKEIKEDVILS